MRKHAKIETLASDLNNLPFDKYERGNQAALHKESNCYEVQVSQYLRVMEGRQTVYKRIPLKETHITSGEYLRPISDNFRAPWQQLATSARLHGNKQSLSSERSNIANRITSLLQQETCARPIGE